MYFEKEASFIMAPCSKMVNSTIIVQIVNGLAIESISKLSNMNLVLEVHFLSQYIIKKRMKNNAVVKIKRQTTIISQGCLVRLKSVSADITKTFFYLFKY